jgi:hypothetical protein
MKQTNTKTTTSDDIVEKKLDVLIKEQRLTNQLLMYDVCIRIGAGKEMVKTKLAAFEKYMEEGAEKENGS